jgi:hypothetical protein
MFCNDLIIFCFLFFKYTLQILVVMKIRFLKSSTDGVPLVVCAIQPPFVIQLNIALQMHNFILSSV